MNARKLLTIGLAGLAGAVAFQQVLHRRRRMSFDGATVVIVGGSRGLGLELARAFAKEGARLSLLARNEGSLANAAAELTHFHNAPVLAQACDVRDREQVHRAIRRTVERFGRIDVLVNNAGIIQFGPAEHMQVEDYRDSVDTHLYGPLYAIFDAIPYMKRQKHGRIVNITSIGGLVALPHAVPYCVGKHALVGLSDGLRAELIHHNIHVTTVAPGLMRTGSHVNAFFKGQHQREYAWFTLGNAIPLFSTNSKRAARRIVRAARYGDTHLTLTLPAKMLRMANAVWPRMVARRMQMGAWLLPRSVAAPEADTLQPGRQLRTRLTRSVLTRASDRAIAMNNER